MRMEKLFTVMVTGGAAMTTGCTTAPGEPAVAGPTASTDGGRDAADAGARDGIITVDSAGLADGGRADGVSSWMNWFSLPDGE